MPKGEGKDESVPGGESAELQIKLRREKIENVLGSLESELVRLVEELKVVRKMLREEGG